MKKCLFVLFSMITLSADAFWQIEADGSCAHQPWVWPFHAGRDEYLFCGAHKATCGGDYASADELKNSVVWAEHSESATIDGSTYWCCGGKVNTKPEKRKGSATGKAGHWVKGDKFIVEGPEIKQKSVAGGTCSYTESKDICGNIITTEGTCETQTKKNMTCPEGQYFREASGSCAKLCATGYAYESKTSNVCVECEETLTQGRVSDDGSTPVNEAVDSVHAICLKCNPATSILDQATRKCVPRPQLTALTMNDLLYGKDGYTKNKNVSEQCWTKYGNEYKKCVLKK